MSEGCRHEFIAVQVGNAQYTTTAKCRKCGFMPASTVHEEYYKDMINTKLDRIENRLVVMNRMLEEALAKLSKA